MIVDVTSAATSRRVAHLEAVKRDLDITDTSEDASLLQAIDIVSGEFSRVLGFEPWMQTYLVRLPGNGGTLLRLPVYPLVSVSQVRYGVADPQVVTASDYEIRGSSSPQEAGFRSCLYNSTGWAKTAPRDPSHTSADMRALYYEVTGVAGWATPIDKWSADTLVRVGEYTRSSDRSVALRFEATAVAGDAKTGTTEPTWPTTAGDTVVDDQVTWTARTAYEMPENLWAAAMWAVKFVFNQGDLITAQAPGVKSMSGGGMRIEWDAGMGASAASILPAVSYSQAELYAS